MLRVERPAAAARFLREHVRGQLHSDSRRLQPGDGFVAMPGRHVDARRLVPQALAAGAAACLVEAEGADPALLSDPRVAALSGLAPQAGEVAAAFHGHPSDRLQVLAVTGTNGKTSCSWWLAQALAACGRPAAVCGTLGAGVPPDAVVPTGLTTPDAVSLQGLWRRFADQGLQACVVEASSIGIVEHRLAGTRLAVALFTNLTQDHLDHHGSMQAYWEAKRSLFAWPGLRTAVVNVDDEHGASLAAELQGRGLPVIACALQRPATLSGGPLRHDAGGLNFDVVEGGERVRVGSRMVGAYNASNLLLVLGGLRALGVPLAEGAAALAGLQPVPGRLQRADDGRVDQPVVLVDYAHTPDALDKVLQALRPLADARAGRLWCVFGCGGNRDSGKRPLMGAIAEARADQVVLTSDNPRDESPAYILSQILAGVVGHDDVAVIEDRAQAIAHAVATSAASDVVLLAGKGHEAEQEVAGVKRPFSDLALAREALARRGARA